MAVRKLIGHKKKYITQKKAKDKLGTLTVMCKTILDIQKVRLSGQFSPHFINNHISPKLTLTAKILSKTKQKKLG